MKMPMGDGPAETEAEKRAFEALDRFMTAFNARDSAGVAEAFNFPHVRLASGEVTRLERSDLSGTRFDRLEERYGWHHSAWDYRHVVQSRDDKVHMAVQFTRYRADGSIIGHFESLWVVTNVDGHWGTQMRSSFAP